MSVIIQQLDQADLMLANALQEPTIRERLAEVGYTEVKIQIGISTVANTRSLVKGVQDAYTTKKITSDQTQAATAELRKNFGEHRSVAKMAFRRTPEVYAELQLATPISKKQSVWLDQAQDFYSAIGPHTKVMQRYDVPKAELEQVATQLRSVKTLRQSSLKKKGLAQNATCRRDEAMQELREWLARFRSAARLALADQPQLLEVLGIIVPA